VKVVERAAPVQCTPWGLVDTLDMVGHVTADQRLVAFAENGVVVDVMKQGVQDRLATTESGVESLQQELAAVKDELVKMKQILSQYTPSPGVEQPGQTAGRNRGGRRRTPGGSAPGGAQP
jgi:hypothetical protein